MLDNPELVKMHGQRQGMSNDVTSIMGMNVIGGEDLEEESTESLINSHRRSRSQSNIINLKYIY